MLYFFNNSPFNTGTQLGPIDTYIGDGSTSSFTLVNNTSLTVGDTIQAEAIEYSRFNGGYGLSGNTFTLSSVPPLSAGIVAPSLGALLLPSYDQTTIPGVSSPANVVQVPCWAMDPYLIGNYSYIPIPGNPDLLVSFTDWTAAGPDTSWLQLAPALANLTAGTYLSAGTALPLAPIQAADTLQVGCSSSATSITVADGSQFTAGSYIMINFGGGTQEIVNISSIASNVLTISGTDFAHSMGETVFHCGWKFWVKMTVPINISGGTPINFYNISIGISGMSISKV